MSSHPRIEVRPPERAYIGVLSGLGWKILSPRCSLAGCSADFDTIADLKPVVEDGRVYLTSTLAVTEGATGSPGWPENAMTVQ